MSKFRWMTVYIYYTEEGKLNLDKDTVIVEVKGNKYKEIATGTILRSKNFDLTELKGAYQLRTEYFLGIIHDKKIIPELDKKGIYLCVNQDGKKYDLSSGPSLEDVEDYLYFFEDSKLNHYLQQKKKEREEHDYNNIKKLIRSIKNN